MAHETLTSLRSAVLLSRSMRGLAERGEFRDLILQMRERDLLLAGVFPLLASLKQRETEGAPGKDVWVEVLAVLKECEQENALLIEALKAQRRTVVRNIAEAEGHRRLSAYAV